LFIGDEDSERVLCATSSNEKALSFMKRSHVAWMPVCLTMMGFLGACGDSAEHSDTAVAALDETPRVASIAAVVDAETTRASRDGTITEKDVRDILSAASDVALHSPNARYVADDARWHKDSCDPLAAVYRRMVDGVGATVFTPSAELALHRRLMVHFANREFDGSIEPWRGVDAAMPVGVTRVPPPILGFAFFNATTEVEKYGRELRRAKDAHDVGRKLGPRWTQAILQDVLLAEVHRGRDWIFTNESVFAAFRTFVTGLATLGMPLDVGSDDTDESLLITLAKMGFRGVSGKHRAELLNALLEAGATPDYQRLNWARGSSGGGANTGPTALIYAVIEDSAFALDAVSALLRHGANPCKRVSGTTYELAYWQVSDDAGYMTSVGAPVADGSALDYAASPALRERLRAAGCLVSGQ
jgi:hypothetical protein